MIDVCCAIIVEGSKILSVQRGPETNHPWQWEFPGGKKMPEESAEQCIVREIEEELKIHIEIRDKLESIDFDYGRNQIHLIPFVCRVVSGELVLTEHVAVQWFDLNDWQLFSWSEADHQLILQNLKSMKLMI